MRDPKVIQAEIAKLEAELEDVKFHEAKTSSAVHILKNLGWTWTRQTGWKKQEVNNLSHKVFDNDTMTHIKAGDWVKINMEVVDNCIRSVSGKFVKVSDDWVKVDTEVVGGYVRSVNGKYAQVSYIAGVTPRGAIVSNKTYMVPTDLLTVVSYEDIIKSR